VGIWSVKRRRYLAAVKRISDAYLHNTLLIAASSMELNKLQLLCNRRSFINRITNMLTSKENKYKNINVTSFMRVVLFLFSIHKVVRPADADEIANLAQKFGDRCCKTPKRQAEVISAFND